MLKKLKKRKPMRKRILPVLCVMMLLVLGCIGFTGCGAEKEVDEKLEDLEFTVVGERDGPPALTELI